MDYQKIADERINLADLPGTQRERLSIKTSERMKEEYVIDAHSHIFDIKCVNKSYFIIRFIKDIFGLRSAPEGDVEFSVNEAYKNKSIYEEGWEDELLRELESGRAIRIADSEVPARGIIDVAKATVFLTLKRMRDVYDYYLRHYSLARSYGIKKSNVISTALAMDLETGWGVKIKKTLKNQITELKRLSLSKPILPFMGCDPRRADLTGRDKNLYSLFSYAFCQPPYFSGIKIYPALGYDPFDYRLWPIYKICERYSIPVLTHCGGGIISTDDLCFEVYVGERKEIIKAHNRKGIAEILNNPERWIPVLEKFPKLRVDFGHFGGYDTWASSKSVTDGTDTQHRKECIFGLMNKYDNVYADFSYNFVEDYLSANLVKVLATNKKVRERTLFGTDYWMVTPDSNMKDRQDEFIARLEDASQDSFDLVKMLLIDNPTKYLCS